MTTIKSYTDIEQSKKLAEILPLESADMIYRPIMYIDSMSNSGFLDIPDCYPFNDFKNSIIKPLPCWSLAALLNIIPQEIFDGAYVINITERNNNTWILTYGYRENRNHSYDGLSSNADYFIDACYEMILKLNELKLL